MIIKLQDPAQLKMHDKLTMYVFSSPDCIPCKFLNPIMDKVATNNDSINIYRINCLDFPELANAFGVKSVPTAFFFYNKQLKHTLKSVAGIKHHLDLMYV